MGKLGRETPEVSCTVYYEEHEWKALVAYSTRNSVPPEHPPSLSETMRMVAQIGSKLHLLNLPGILDHASIKEAILSESYVSDVYDLFKKLDIVFIGLGAPTPDSVIMRDGTILSEKELEMLLEKGAVGDIALRFLDKDGNIIQSEINDRVIGISLEELKNTRQVIGLAGGPEKVDIIRAALRGKFIDHLITDHLTGKKLLID